MFSRPEIYTLFNDHARWHGQRLIFLDNNIPDIYVKSAVFLNSEPNLTKKCILYEQNVNMSPSFFLGWRMNIISHFW